MGGKEGHISSTPSRASWDDVLHVSIGHSLLFSSEPPLRVCCVCVVFSGEKEIFSNTRICCLKEGALV